MKKIEDLEYETQGHINTDQNIVTQNTGLLKSLDILNEENRDLISTHDDIYKINKKLTSALKQAVKVIKQRYDVGSYLSGKPKEVAEELWFSYWENAPEIKEIKEALKEQEYGN